MIKQSILFCIIFLNIASQVETSYAIKAGHILGKSISLIGLNFFAVKTLGIKFLYEQSLKSTIQTQENIPLNNREESKEIIKSLLDTYNNGQSITLYSEPVPKNDDSVKTIIKYDPFMQATAFSDWIYLHGYTRDCLLDTQTGNTHLAAQAVIGHEIGHIVNKDIYKSNLFLIGNSALTTYCSFQGIKRIKKLIPQSKIVSIALMAPLIYCKNKVDTLNFCAFLRYREEKADQHLIAHTKDQHVLLSLAEEFKKLEERAHNKDMSFFSTHPTYKKRIAYFEHAAATLEKNQNATF